MHSPSRRTVFAAAACLLVLAIALAVPALLVKSRIQTLFRLNRQLQAERYAMHEFEYRMLGILYLLDRGRITEGFTLFDRYYRQLQTREGLTRLPQFASDDEELNFYLSLQNPRTGAFMDDAYPPCVYHGPTENVLAHIERLAVKAGRPVILRHPLNYLDDIDTPERLTAFLDDVSTVSRIAALAPQTSFHLARDLLPLARDPQRSPDQLDEMLVERLGLHRFSTEWKMTLLRWFWEAQDPETGLWGPKSASGNLLKRDLQNTASILKAFKDSDGHDLYPQFPTRYTDRLLVSALAILSEPPPPDRDLPRMHEWSLQCTKGIKLVARLLWKNLTPAQRTQAADLMRDYVTAVCEKFYVPAEGGFSYYPNSKHASVDGTGTFLVFDTIGALNAGRRRALWGDLTDSLVHDGTVEGAALGMDLLRALGSRYRINSFRAYAGPPDENDLFAGVRLVFYPTPTPVPDVMELNRGMRHFLLTTNLAMGNWTSRETALERLNTVTVPANVLYGDDIPAGEFQRLLRERRQLVILGFDRLQVPRVRLVVK